MSDPRDVGPQVRRANLSPLMRALGRKSQGEVVNFCPFGCADEKLDQNGFCGHLVGFYNGGQTYEPRLKHKKSGRIGVVGAKRRAMEKGFRLVQITTSARVYSPAYNADLAPADRSEYDEAHAEIIAQEKKLLDAAERIRTPVLEGEWGVTEYDSPVSPDGAPPSSLASLAGA